MDTLTIETLVDLAALPDAEWRTLCSAMSYYARKGTAEAHPLMAVHFDGPVALHHWNAIRHEVNHVRLRIEEAKLDGQHVTRKDYMRLYMRKRRAGEV